MERLKYDGEEFYARNRPKRLKSAFIHDGIRYVTEEELWIAEMLSALGIAFLYEVEFSFFSSGKSYDWAPDFVFGWYRWMGEPCHNSTIMGIEVKRSDRSLGRSLALNMEFGIPILMLTREDLEPYHLEFKKNGTPFPLKVTAR